MSLKRSRTPLSRLVCVGLIAAAASLPAAAAPIKDVAKSQPVYVSVKSVTDKKLMDAPGGVFNGDKPVTRYELAVTLDRMVKYIEEGRKPLHRQPRPKAAAIPSSASPAVANALRYLTSECFIPTNSFLLSGTGKEVVTANQLAEAFRQVAVALSDRSLPPLAE